MQGIFATKFELFHANFRPFLNNIAHCAAETVAEAPQLHSFGSSAARASSWVAFVVVERVKQCLTSSRPFDKSPTCSQSCEY